MTLGTLRFFSNQRGRSDRADCLFDRGEVAKVGWLIVPTHDLPLTRGGGLLARRLLPPLAEHIAAERGGAVTVQDLRGATSPAADSQVPIGKWGFGLGLTIQHFVAHDEMPRCRWWAARVSIPAPWD